MRTSILVDDSLVSAAMQASGARSKCEAVELGLKALIRLGNQEKSRSLRGMLRWEGDLDLMRRDR